MFTIRNKKGQCLTRATAQILDICEVVEDPKISGLVMYVWGAKAAKGRAAFIQNLIDQGKL